MRSRIFSRLNLWPSLLTCLFALFIGVSSAQAQDLPAEIATLQEQYAKLENEFFASQARIDSSARTFEVQETAYRQLDSVAQILVSMNRELDVLNMTLLMASMVTEKRFLPSADRVIDLQRSHMTNRVSRAVPYIEKMMPRVKDSETMRLLIEARDLLRSSSNLLGRLSVTETKKK
jgi:hypothetical protein